MIATLWQSTTKYIQIKANFAGNSIDFVVKDGSTGPTTYSVTGKEDIITGNPNFHRVNDKFYFLRGSPILLAVTRSGTTYKFFASVGGTEVSFTTQSLTGVALQPTAIRFGNPIGANPESMYWYGGEVQQTVAESEAVTKGSLEALSFLIEN